MLQAMAQSKPYPEICQAITGFSGPETDWQLILAAPKSSIAIDAAKGVGVCAIWVPHQALKHPPSAAQEGRTVCSMAWAQDRRLIN